ncbi:MAG: hypothetical protein V1676_00160 [Candidatus Diapherotrites archaeon]
MSPLESETTITVYEPDKKKNPGKFYYRTNIPKRVAEEMLCLGVVREKQKIIWRIEGSKVIVAKVPTLRVKKQHKL